MPAKKKSAKKQLTKRFLAANPFSPPQLFAFVGLFVVVGVYILIRAFASSPLDVPTASDQIVLTYSLPHGHPRSATELTDSINDAAVLYGNGLLLCSTADSNNNHRKNPVTTTTLSSAEISTLVKEISNKGFFGLSASYDTLGVAADEFSTDITVNLKTGAKDVGYLSGPKPAAFSSAEASINARCAKASKPYKPEGVVLKSRIASDSDNVDQASFDGSSLPVSDSNEIVSTELHGSDASHAFDLMKGANRAKVTKNGKSYAVGLDMIYPTAKPLSVAKQKPGTAEAASAEPVRWYWWYAADQALYSANTSLAAYAKSVDSFYTAQIYNKVSTLAPQHVIRGSHAASYYRVCHTTACTNYTGTSFSTNCQNCNKIDWIMYSNIHDEMTAAGQIPAGQSVNVLSELRSGYGLHYCSGIGNGGYESGFGVSFSDGDTANCYGNVMYAIMAHEAGHSFGLAHTCNEAGSVMDMCNTAVYSWPSGYHVNTGQRGALNVHGLAFNQHITGHVYNGSTGAGLSGVSIYTCNYGTIKTDGAGNFDLRIITKGSYCIRVSAGAPSGAILTTVQNSEHTGATSYEYQVAGYNCYHNTACSVGAQTWDRADNGYSFKYTPVATPTPTPTPTP